MTSQLKNFYPPLDLCEACWEERYTYKNRYGTTDSKDLKHRGKASIKQDIYNAQGKTCLLCDAEIPGDRKLERENVNVGWDKTYKIKLACTIFIIVILILILYLLLGKSLGYFSDARSKASENILKTELPKLKQKYPNQKPELWHNVLKITNYTKPLVQVLILLHKGNSEAVECFARDLVNLINQITKKTGLAIYKENSKVTEYGEELSHYLNLVREHNHLIVFQLNKMSGSTARMFHFLCDETPVSILPSFFIFTLEDEANESSEVARPAIRASRILRSAWSNLMENELHPLISRVVRNVAEMLPENITC